MQLDCKESIYSQAAIILPVVESNECGELRRASRLKAQTRAGWRWASSFGDSLSWQHSAMYLTLRCRAFRIRRLLIEDLCVESGMEKPPAKKELNRGKAVRACMHLHTCENLPFDPTSTSSLALLNTGRAQSSSMSQDHQSASPQQSQSEKRIATTLAALDDEVQQAASPLGEHHNRFGILGIVGLSYAVLNSPTAMSASLSVVLTSGVSSAELDQVVSR